MDENQLAKLQRQAELLAQRYPMSPEMIAAGLAEYQQQPEYTPGIDPQGNQNWLSQFVNAAKVFNPKPGRPLPVTATTGARG